jgi:hypothetical protein
MHRNRILAILIATILIPTAIGCDEEERLVKMAEEHLERQADQNRRMSELQKHVAEGARQLVEADANARKEMVALQREVQTERAEVGRQRDILENERRDFAAKRRLDPIIASAVRSIGLLLACVLPLVLCWYLLRQPVEPADDQAVAEVLLEDLVADDPLLLPRMDTRRAIGFRDENDSQPMSDENDGPDETA